MSTKVTERPAAYSFSKNEIRYKFLTDNLAPAKQFVQVELFARLLKTASILNWTIDQKGDPYLDNNLIIDVNGERVVSMYFPGSGSLNLSAGDAVVIQQIIYDAWSGTDPYVKMIIKKDEEELYNEFSIDGTLAVAQTWSFTVEANRTYTVYTYTELDAVLPGTDSRPTPSVSSFTKLKTFNLKPNTDGYTYLYIDAFIDSLLRWILPAQSDAYTNGSEQCCEFYIAFREISAITPDPAWIVTEKDHTRVAIKGGIEKQKSSRNNYFNYQAVNKSFFTWMPGQRFIFKDQPVWLSALIKTAGTYKLHIAVTKTDGTTVTDDRTLAFTSGIFFHINVSYSSLGIAALVTEAQVHYYEVSITNEAGDTIIYAAYRLYIEYRPLYDLFDLIYHNSLGGIDSARVKGDLQIGFEKEIQALGGGMTNTGWSDKVKTGESSQVIAKRDFYKGDLGFIHGKAEQEALQDLLISSSVFQFVDSRMVPVLNLQTSVNFRKTTDKIFSLPIEWQLPFSNQVSTPKSITLGMGEDTETYE